MNKELEEFNKLRDKKLEELNLERDKKLDQKLFCLKEDIFIHINKVVKELPMHKISPETKELFRLNNEAHDKIQETLNEMRPSFRMLKNAEITGNALSKFGKFVFTIFVYGSVIIGGIGSLLYALKNWINK